MKKKILIFTRPWMTEFYLNVLNKSVVNDFQKVFLTEFKKEENSLENCYRIDYSKKSTKHYSYTFFTDSEVYDIIIRDRYLVTCSFQQAVKYINTITEQILEIYENEKPDIVFGHLADTYIFDIYYRIAKRKNIFCFSFLWSGIVNNTFIFLDYLTPIKRVENNQDIDLFDILASKRDDISNPIIKEFDLYDRVINKLKWMKTLIKVSNPLEKEYHNIYYEFRRKAVVAIPHLNIIDLMSNYYIKNINNIPFTKHKKIYISLHYVPEATLNNFAESNSVINHDSVILDIIKKYHDKYQFIIKEHPAMYNNRNLEFYKQLKKYTNVVLLHPSIKYYTVFEIVDFVLSWGGTVGIEAPFFNIKTINITKPIYHIDGYNNYFIDYKDVIENFSDKLESINYDNSQYCQELNKFYQSILFNGAANERFNTKDNIKIIGKEINILIKDIYKLV